MATTYPRRLIEVDLPIKRISAHARREKSIRHGHISTLHIWWARRPLASCRAVICAALWPDPADELCPPMFRRAAAHVLAQFAERVRGDAALAELSQASWSRWKRTNEHSLRADDPACWPELRYALLDFIADFANWDASTVSAYLETARALTQAAHQALGGEPGTRPLVVDPFAGGGAIPLEALRVGADAFASDLNPVAVLLNKVVLEYIPKYGQRLADEVRKWGEWVKEQAEKELAEFYPNDPDGATPIAYLWARTITCEGPGCGAEIPLIRSLWLSKKANRSTALRLMPNLKQKRVDFEIIQNAKAKEVFDGTVRKGSATCPCCGFTTPVTSVRRQFKTRRGGTMDARLFCVVTTWSGEQGRFYRLPTELDLVAAHAAAAKLDCWKRMHKGTLSLVPEEAISHEGSYRIIKMLIYGAETWGDLFTPRQALALAKLVQLVGELESHREESIDGLTPIIQTVLGLAISRIADRLSANCTWRPQADQEKVEHAFTRQALPMTWDFAEGTPLSSGTAGWDDAYEPPAQLIEALGSLRFENNSTVANASATEHPLPNDAAEALFTDPPYYHAISYACLSDYFYVWLRRVLQPAYPHLFQFPTVPKDGEIIVDLPHELNTSQKDIVFYESQLTRSFAEGRRVVRPDGIGVIVFASKTTSSWEAILQAVIEAGWTITGSWPIDTEMANRVAAQSQARLASSIHLVCRPREQADGTLTENIGDWRDVLRELPIRIHEWMPRLATEGVVGADAIFACLGPALEVFSRYSTVEKASGEQVKLGEYLEHVWAAVSREALSLLFKDADAGGLEPDARLTAMWLWTLSTADEGRKTKDEGEDDAADGDEEEGANGRGGTKGGFSLEFDAARKIAQGLGANLDILRHIVEVKGETARLLGVGERTHYLFGKDEAQAPSSRRPKKNAQQLSMFAELEQADHDAGWGDKSAPKPGATVLDRVHQAMILFAAGRAEAMKRFLVEEGAGNDARFWKLAQSLSALYPAATDEKRWVDGVLARKKGLGF